MFFLLLLKCNIFGVCLKNAQIWAWYKIYYNKFWVIVCNIIVTGPTNNMI